MGSQVKQLKISVGGMTCNHCKMNVEKKIANIQGIDSVFADPDTEEVVVMGEDIDLKKIEEAVEDIGYSYKGVRES